MAARACDRHFGIGADGFIRAARSTASRAGQKLLEEHPDAVWFMDYRNGDGSIAEMCGNGVRAFVEYLRTEGLIELEVGETVKIGTRAGVKTVARTEDGYALIWVRGASFTVTLPARGARTAWCLLAA